MMRVLMMIVLAAFAASAAPAPEWLDGLQDAARRTVEQWRAVSRETDEALAGLAAEEPETAADDEGADLQAAEGDTQAFCRGGLMFDTDANTLTYLDHVWLADERLSLYAEHRLYIRLKRDSMHGGTAEKATAQNAGRVEEELADRAGNLPGELRGGRITIETTEAVADTDANILLLTSPAKGLPIMVAQGRNSIRIEPREGKPALLLADAEGNALLSGAHISLRWVDADGREGKLECAGGSISYHAATHTLYMPGLVSMEHPRGSFVSESALTVALQAESPAGKKDMSFLEQFAGMRVNGLERVTVQDGRAAFDTYAARGELMDYNAVTGACRVAGKGSFLQYNRNTVSTDGALELHENGDIDMEGDHVCIRYERPSQKEPEQPLHGSLNGTAMHFCAATGKVSTPGPLTIRDEELNFSCDGPVELTLRRAAQPRTQRGAGMPNLALAQYDSISALSAQGNVRLAALSAQGDLAVAGDAVQADMDAQSATVTARAGTPLVAQGNGFRAAAETAAGAQSTLQVTPQGDISLAGNHISIEAAAEGNAKSTVVAITRDRPSSLHVNTAGDITLLGADIGIETHDAAGNTVKAVCTDRLTLEKEAGRLTTGSATRMQAAQGIFCANGPVTAVLRQGGKAPARREGRFAHLSYAFEGLESAATPSGGSIQTPQGSMQCSGRIEIAFGAEPAARKAPRGGQELPGNLKSARAEGNVVLAGTDSSGRVLRASGDTLTLDAATGVKTLTGGTVTLSDKYNTHTASGGASITIDARNNARISGATQRSTATGIQDQIQQTQKGK